jgi:hypothetical protein
MIKCITGFMEKILEAAGFERISGHYKLQKILDALMFTLD